MKQFTNCD